MINTELLLTYIVKNKLYVKDIADKLNLTELSFIKKVGNMSDFTFEQINTLCDVLRIPKSDAVKVFFR